MVCEPEVRCQRKPGAQIVLPLLPVKPRYRISSARLPESDLDPLRRSPPPLHPGRGKTTDCIILRPRHVGVQLPPETRRHRDGVRGKEPADDLSRQRETLTQGAECL